MQESRIGKGATSLFLANVSSLIASTLYFIVLTNILESTTLVGVVTSLNIFIWLFALICLFAQPVVQGGPIPAPLAVLRFVPKYLANNDRDSAAKVFRFSLALSGAVGLIVMGFLMVLPTVVTPILGGAAVRPEFVRFAAIDILIVSMGQVCLGEIFALGKSKVGSFYIVAWSVGRAFLSALLLVPYGVSGVLIGWIGGDLFLIAITSWALRRTLKVSGSGGGFSAADVGRYSLYTLFAALLGFIINQADRLITLSQRGLPGLAIYNVASVGSGVAGYAPSALVTVLLPSLAALLASNDMKEMRNRIRISTRYVSLLAIPVAFGLAGVMEIPLRIFGSDYLAGLLPGVILSVATGLTALSAVYAVALLAQGNLRWYTIGNVLGLVALFLIAGVLTPIIGLTGPAVGRAGLMAVVTLVFAIGSSRVKIFEVDIRAFVFSSISAAIMMVFFLVTLSMLHGFLLKIAILPLLLGVGLAIYVLALRMFRFVTIEDIEFIGKLLPRRLHGIIPILARLIGIDFPQRSQPQPP